MDGCVYVCTAMYMLDVLFIHVCMYVLVYVCICPKFTRLLYTGFRRNTTQQNTSNTSAMLNNAHNNGSVSESPSIYEPRPEPYMYGVPDWYLHAVVKLVSST